MTYTVNKYWTSKLSERGEHVVGGRSFFFAVVGATGESDQWYSLIGKDHSARKRAGLFPTGSLF